MNARWIFRFFLVLALVAVAAGMAWYAYNLGMNQGLATNVELQVPEGGPAPVPYYGAPYFYRPFGGPFFHPFGFLSCLFPLFLIFLFFGLMRAIFWHGPMHRHGWRHGYWEGRTPPFFDEWHRRAHEGTGPEAKAPESGQ